MAKSVEEMLGEMNKTWSRSKNGPVTPPDGEYMMQLVSAEIRPNKAGDKLICFRQHVIIEGEFANVVVRDFISLTENQIFRLNQWIGQMGYEAPDDLREAPAVLEAIIAENPTYTANLKSSGDFLNITDFEIVESGTKAAPEPEPEEEAEEDEPVVEEPTEVSEEEDEPESDYEDQDHVDLYGIAAACSVEVKDGLSKDKLLEAMGDYDWDFNDFKNNPDGLALVKKYGLDVINEPVATSSVKKAKPAAKRK